jgi:hypothetical protein
VTASEPIRGIDGASFRLFDEAGAEVPGSIAQIADYTWAFFPDQVFLTAGHAYRVRLAGVFCDYADNCIDQDRSFGFTVASTEIAGNGDTRPPPPRPAPPPPRSTVRASALEIPRAEPWLVGLGSALLLWFVTRSRSAWMAALVPARRRLRG